MPTPYFDLSRVDPSWHACINEALTTMDPNYLASLYHNKTWLPGPQQIFNAFSLPVKQVNYVLFGESPYPRAESANGYAFWDAAVKEIWSEKGLSKKVNRATSLRNIMKMLLIAEGLLNPLQTTGEEITRINKDNLIKNNDNLFNNFLKHGFLLLNASLVFHDAAQVKKDALAWSPFLKHILHFLCQNKPDIKFILFGRIALIIDKLLDLPHLTKLYAEHPYNLSFINNPDVINFFKPLHLLTV